MTYETFQEKVRKRNLKILERRKRGESSRCIAERYNVSVSLVGFILRCGSEVTNCLLPSDRQTT